MKWRAVGNKTAVIGEWMKEFMNTVQIKPLNFSSYATLKPLVSIIKTKRRMLPARRHQENNTHSSEFMSVETSGLYTYD